MTLQTTADFIADLNRLNVQLRVEGDHQTPFDQLRLRCTAPAGVITAELRQQLVERKAELIAHLLTPAEPFLLQQAPAGTHFPLSFAQQRLWFLAQLAPGNPFYNIPAAISLKGQLDPRALERSFQEIVRRHAALRTTFTTVNSEPVQVISANTEVKLTVIDLHRVAIADRQRIGQQFATTEARHPFNLEAGPLLRVTLLQFDPIEATLLITLHHIVADGWSLGVFMQELACCYRAFVKGESPDLPPLPIQYTDFACWQRRWLQGAVLETQMAYWQRQLQDLPILNLPGDRPRPATPTYRGATCPIHIPAPLALALAELSQQAGVSLFMILLAAFQTLLYRYTSQEDLAVGVPIANRHYRQVEGLIGFFVNSLVMRTDLSGHPTFRDLLQRVRQVALAAYSHQDIPFEQLVEALEPDRDLSRNPLFQVAFALQNAPMQPLELPGLTLEPLPFGASSSRFDLEIHLWEPRHGLHQIWQSEAGLSGFVAYSVDLFNRDRIERLIEHFQTLLAGIVAHPDAHLAELPLLTVAEQQRLAEFGGFRTAHSEQTAAERTPQLCFHHIFEAQVVRTPAAIALVSEQETFTYTELNQQANQLARILKELGVRSNTLVGLCVERSAEMVIGILGILKAGAAYVPLDSGYPSERLQFMLTDTQVPLLLTQSELVSALPPSSARLICLDQLHDFNQLDSVQDREAAPEDGEVEVDADHLAYVIYTSGSTGIPKGVLLRHRGLCNVVEAQRQLFQASSQSRVLQFSSLSFDASVFEMALAFGCGGSLYIPPAAARLPGTALIEFLQRHAITHALLTPSVLAVLPSADLPDLQVLITGGELCSSQVVDRWAVNRNFFNAYGPTETTIWATVAPLHSGDSPGNIGRPVLNTQVQILDQHLNPVPIGVPGQIYIGGKGLAQGYLNRPELTADRFVRIGDATFYQTGDLGCYHADDNIEFLGRLDNQIKLRGFRVELGEIEATLHRHPAIQEAVVLPIDADATGLVAYFTLDRSALPTLLRPLQAQQIQQWQTLYDQTYQQPFPADSTAAACFNTVGWNRSDTGAAIPPEQMQEWVGDRVQQILALHPQRVLEIGCGTGLLLFQIAPHCQQYVGTDFSTVALAAIQPQLKPLGLTHVELLHRLATDFTGIPPASFDVVILNSIVQYFPSRDYLIQVIDQAIGTVAPGGVLFLGDVRSLPLLNAFHASTRFAQADASLERDALHQQVERSQFEDPELAIHPDLFRVLPQRFSRIQQVQIRLSRGSTDNEMTQFRYNVLLHVGNAENTPNPIDYLPKHNWKQHPVTPAETQQRLMQNSPPGLLITGVANASVQRAVQIANWLGGQTAPRTVGQMRERLQTITEAAIRPQDWWNLECLLPYRVEVTWSAQGQTGDYDVLLIRKDIHAKIDVSLHSTHPAWNDDTNQPLQSTFTRQLIPELRQLLKQTLPDYMVPAVWVPLHKIPLTVSGKVDRTRLMQQYRRSATLQEHIIPDSAVTATAISLTEIWKDLLHLQQISVNDNFFELGGHSLLATQLAARIRDAFGLELPLKTVFEAPTVAQLAIQIEALRHSHPNSSLPPLVRLDRSAYRRKRSIPAAPVQPTPDPRPAPEPALHTQRPSLSQPRQMARSPLVLLTQGHQSSAFFCVHPLFGVVFPYLELAQLLESDRSFYGLQPLGLDGQSTPLNRIEAMAADYIRAIQTVQPSGPYLLGGWSFGGLVAFEMAQQLTRSGETVELLAILDSPAPCHQPTFLQNLKFLLGTALWSLVPFLQDYGALVSQKLQAPKLGWDRWHWAALARLIPEAQSQLLDESAVRPLLRIAAANAEAAYRYVPQRYPQQIALFRAAEASETADATLGWAALAARVQLHFVSGNHLSLLKQPHVQELAEQLRPYLRHPQDQ